MVICAVPRKILKEQFDVDLEPDEATTNPNSLEVEDDLDNYDAAGNEFIRESAASPPSPKVVMLHTHEDNLTKYTPATSIQKPPNSKSSSGESGTYLIIGHVED